MPILISNGNCAKYSVTQEEVRLNAAEIAVSAQKAPFCATFLTILGHYTLYIIKKM